jgi:hypothetical protein
MDPGKNKKTKAIGTKSREKDILTEMFEHFGIEVVEVKAQIPETKNKKTK